MRFPRPTRPQQDGSARPVGDLYTVNPFRRLLFGNPIATEHSEHARLSKIIALPVFASDAISSVAYATQEILLVLGAAGIWLNTGLYHQLTMGITASIVALLVIVVFSYRQTIFAYPHGGGSYSVTKENLGTYPGLIAAGALLMDYVLTVSVSIASGVQNLLATPFCEPIRNQTVLVCLVCIAFIGLMNLRGLKESGALFAAPTYSFILFAVLMIGLGLTGHAKASDVPHSLPNGSYEHFSGALPLVLLISVILKAFASGCSAMTGTEAVSNGVPAFRKPEPHNAATTLGVMAVILGVLFLGISGLAVKLGVVYGHGHGFMSQPVIEQLSGAVFGRNTVLYYCMVVATAAILLLAANTSFADFPRLSAILSRDRFMPRQMSSVGDKLVFSNGILLLGLCASALIVLFHGNVDKLIPLYAVGVFTAFTLSQASMVRRWNHLRTPGWWFKATVNGFGALCTGTVLVVIMVEKFVAGAWVVVVLVAFLVFCFRRIHRHYEWLRSRLTIIGWKPESAPLSNTVLVLVPSLHRGVFPAIDYARGLSPDCRGIHIDTDPPDTQRLNREWEQYVGDDIPLVVLPSPYRSLIGPLVAYVRQALRERDNHIVTVVIPEFVPGRWWHGFLHNSNSFLVKYYLGRVPGVVLTNVRYFVPANPADAPFATTGQPADGPAGHSGTPGSH